MKLLRPLLAAALAAAALAVAAPPAGAGPSVDVRAFGPAPALGAPDVPLNGRIVDVAAHPTRNGYWLLGRDGGVFSYGVPFHGSTGGMRLNSPVNAMAPTPTGNGYWFSADDGGVFSFGDARFFGSMGGLPLNSPVVGMAARPQGDGYWLVARDGGVFSFGNARFHGSLAGVWTGTHVVGIAASRTGNGYVLLGANGAMFSFGDAPRLTAAPMPQGAADITLTRSGNGAWVVGTDGAVYAYGDAPFRGGANDAGRVGAGIAASASAGGYWVALVPRPPAAGPPLPPGSGEGRRIVYSNSMQRVWLVEADGVPSHSFLVSGKRGVPAPGTYRVFSKSTMSSAKGGTLRLPYMTRFAWGKSLAIGFHGIPLRGDGTPIQSDSELGQFRSAGCVRMNQQDVKTLFFWAPVGTTVVVTP
ncbi:MAG: hypothetical protein KatS3mg009_3308 [Acidimicrobiia bacterium]|nr:MAG: hypothetical protein KatS3mg009_3308 [Acidimicrobiia bacterium]